MWKVFVLTAVIVVLCVAGLSFNILRGKEFPQTEVSGNREMKRLGIRCAKEEEMRLRRKAEGRKAVRECSENDCSACGACPDKIENKKDTL